MSKKTEIPDGAANENVRRFYEEAYKDGRRDTVKKMIERIKSLELTPDDKRYVIETIKSTLFV